MQVCFGEFADTFWSNGVALRGEPHLRADTMFDFLCQINRKHISPFLVLNAIWLLF